MPVQEDRGEDCVLILDPLGSYSLAAVAEPGPPCSMGTAGLFRDSLGQGPPKGDGWQSFMCDTLKWWLAFPGSR